MTSIHDACIKHADVVVLGSGPAGSAAALTLARLGASVIVVDRSNREVFDDFEARRTSAVRHIKVAEDLEHLANGKVAGALTGSIIAALVNERDLSLFVVIGVAAFLGAGYRVPLAAVMFVAETTGRPSFIVPGLLAAVAAELIMGRSSVTAYQRGAKEPSAPAST